jgi:hypothetical protein
VKSEEAISTIPDRARTTARRVLPAGLSLRTRAERIAENTGCVETRMVLAAIVVYESEAIQVAKCRDRRSPAPAPVTSAVRVGIRRRRAGTPTGAIRIVARRTRYSEMVSGAEAHRRTRIDPHEIDATANSRTKRPVAGT